MPRPYVSIIMRILKSSVVQGSTKMILETGLKILTNTVVNVGTKYLENAIYTKIEGISKNKIGF